MRKKRSRASARLLSFRCLTLAPFHVALHIRAGRDHLVTHALRMLQGMLGQRRRNALAPQVGGNVGAIDIPGLLPKVHVGQIGAMAIHGHLELMTDRIMTDGSLVHVSSHATWTRRLARLPAPVARLLFSSPSRQNARFTLHCWCAPTSCILTATGRCGTFRLSAGSESPLQDVR